MPLQTKSGKTRSIPVMIIVVSMGSSARSVVLLLLLVEEAEDEVGDWRFTAGHQLTTYEGEQGRREMRLGEEKRKSGRIWKNHI